MYAFISYEQILTAENEKREKDMNVMRQDIDEFLWNCLEKAKKGEEFSLKNKLFDFPKTFLATCERSNGIPKFPTEIQQELCEAGFKAEVTLSLPGEEYKYFLLLTTKYATT